MTEVQGGSFSYNNGGVPLLSLCVIVELSVANGAVAHLEGLGQISFAVLVL